MEEKEGFFMGCTPPSPIPVDRFFAPAEGRPSGPVPPTNPLKIKDGNLKLP